MGILIVLKKRKIINLLDHLCSFRTILKLFFVSYIVLRDEILQFLEKTGYTAKSLSKKKIFFVLVK